MPRSLAAKWDRDNHFPRDVFAKLGNLELMGLTVPETYGGADRDIVATMVVIEELARRSLAVAVPYIMAACYGGMNIEECGDEDQKHAYLPRLAAGRMMFAYGWTEPEIGADLASVRTHAERRGDKVIVNGAKRFCSGAGICDFIYALVRTGPQDERHRNLSFLLIPLDVAGVTIEPIDAMGMKGASMTGMTFTDAEIPAANIVGGEAGWNRAWAMLMGPGREVEKLEVAALAVGIARAALEDASLCLRAAPVRQADCRVPIDPAQARGHAHIATRGAADALADGLAGRVKDFPAERYVREALLMPIIGGSSAVQHNNIFKLAVATVD